MMEFDFIDMNGCSINNDVISSGDIIVDYMTIRCQCHQSPQCGAAIGVFNFNFISAQACESIVYLCYPHWLLEWFPKWMSKVCVKSGCVVVGSHWFRPGSGCEGTAVAWVPPGWLGKWTGSGTCCYLRLTGVRGAASGILMADRVHTAWVRTKTKQSNLG